MKNFKKYLGVLVIMACALLIVPNKVNAEEYGDRFKKVMNEEGKLVVKAPAPKTLDEAWYILNEFPYESVEELFFDYCDATYSKCKFTDWETSESHELEIEYVYDEKIAEEVEAYVSRIPTDIEYFSVKDLEIVNYWLNKVSNEEGLDQYSGELKQYLNYNNIEFFVENRMGGFSDFYDFRGGIGMFSYNGDLYKVNTIGTKLEYVLYVPTDTENMDTAKIAALKQRIKEYANVDVEIAVGGNAGDWLQNYVEECRLSRIQISSYNPNLVQELSQMTWEEYYNSDHFEDEREWISFMENYKDDNYYIMKINGEEYNIIIARDSSKMINPTHKTADLETKITVSTKDSSVPLDTYITSKKVDNQTIKDKIGTENYVSYDIKLYSNAKDANITQLENGLFEVSIPVPGSLNGKELIVYYEASDGKLEEHEVTIKDGYAVFTTNHFSEYTLAEKITADSNNTNSENNNTTVDNNGTETEENPKTYDGIMNWAILGFVSMSGIVGTVIYRKKQNI